MPTNMDHEAEEDAKPSASTASPMIKPEIKPSIEVKQLQRYYTVLRDFMAHFHSREEIYPPNHEFTQYELSGVTPKDVIKWMNVKLFNKEEPDEDDRPINGSYHTLDYYKKAISYFMPQKAVTWNPGLESGNPTRSKEVNNLIKRIKELDSEVGSARERKRKAEAAQRNTSTPSDGSPARGKMARGSGTAMAGTVAVAVAPKDAAAMQRLLRTIHAQNASFIDLFGTLSKSLEQFKTTLSCNNMAIMNEINTLNRINSSPMTPGKALPPGVVSSQVATQSGASIGSANNALDWQYVHPDGVRRRVPPTWTFPHSNLQEMYILWHCGDYQNRISPMKHFQNSDVTFLGKRARMNLNEVKNLMCIIDEEAKSKGKVIGQTMDMSQTIDCFNAGLPGINFSTTTPTGKQRNIMRLKWSTMIKYNKQHSAMTEDEEAEEKASQERVDPDDNDPSHDNCWFEHSDGVRRRVPSTYKFPMIGLEDTYVLWHCGDEEQKISGIKFFTKKDVANVKRGATNLSEVRAVMTLIDLEAGKKGMDIKEVMTEEEARACCREGYLGLAIPPNTPDGRPRDILSMKWSSAVRLKGTYDETDAAKPEEDVDNAEDDAEAEVETEVDV